MTTAPVVNGRSDPFASERAELESVQTSALFQRAPNLARILAYVCQKHFQRESSSLKEYNIAVEALGRPPDFDPQADAIVRVDAHLLRKRLHLYYECEGKHHDIQIVLPSGQYAPEFVRNGDAHRNSDAGHTTESSSRVTLIRHGRRQTGGSESEATFTATSQSSYGTVALDDSIIEEPPDSRTDPAEFPPPSQAEASPSQEPS